MANNDYAVVVGINRYPGLSDLKGPENDALAFTAWLVSSSGGQVPEENITTLVSKNYQEINDTSRLKARPTTVDVDSAFDQLIEQGEGLGGSVGRLGRRLYIYLAGHGFGIDIESTALLMANASQVRTGYHIPGRPYANWFRLSALFEEVALFMDCCRDDYRRTPLHLPPWAEMRHPEAAQVRFFYAFATRWSRKARELPGADGLHRGVFTTALLAALEHSLPDEQGRVTGSTIASYIFNYLPRLLPESERQEPEFSYDSQFELVFARRTGISRTRVRITFQDPDPLKGAEVMNSAFQVVKRLESLVPVWELELEQGRYLACVIGTDNRKTIDVIGTEVIDETL